MAWAAIKLHYSNCRQSELVFIEGLEGNPRCSSFTAVFEGIELHSGSGFIHLLSTPYMPGLVKIGFTERDVFERAKELGAVTGVPAPYVVEAYFPARISLTAPCPRRRRSRRRWPASAGSRGARGAP